MPVFELEETNYSGPIPDDTWLTAEVVSVTMQTKKKGTPDEFKKLLWRFVVTEADNEYDGQVVYGDTWPDFNTKPGCKLRNWASEILCVEFPDKYKLDTDDMIGKSCRILVGARTYYSERDGEDRTVNEVKDVMRSRQAMASAVDEF